MSTPCRRALFASIVLAGAGVTCGLVVSPTGPAVARDTPARASGAFAAHGGGNAATIRQIPDRADRDLSRTVLNPDALTPRAVPGLLDVPATAGSASTPRQTLRQAEAALNARQAAEAAAKAKAAAEAKAAAAAKAEAQRLAQSHRWVRPNYGGLSSPFGHRWGRMHEGIDLAGGYGSQILAATSGTVVYAGPESGYGRVVKIADWDGTQTWYGHMSTFLVHVGDKVSPGQPIALVGAAGDATGPHLHFEVRVGGVAVDPIPFLAARGVRI